MQDTLDMFEIQTRDSVVERRNFFLGIWAGRMLGRDGEDLALYAGEIMASDLEEAGPQDVVNRLRRDFAASGVAMDETAILAQLQQTERLVRAELLATD